MVLFVVFYKLHQLLNVALYSVDVLSAVVARGDWGLVMTCLSCIATPTEKSLVSTLQRVLRYAIRELMFYHAD